MSRRKNKTIDELRAAEAKALRERDEKNSLIKELHKQISEAARRERNAHIYFRGGELTHHLGDKAELLSNAASGDKRVPIRNANVQTS